MTTTIKSLPHAKLHPSPFNPRKHARSREEIAALAGSIAARGILQNLVVRKNADGYEIAAGEGRWLAVGFMIEQGNAQADYPMPVQILDLSDEEVIEIGLAENTHRNDLHPLDEARAFQQLVDARAKDGGKKAAADAIKHIAERVNRTTRYVQKRVKIARDLVPEWVQLLEDGTINVAAAQILATVKPETQRDALGLITEGFGKNERTSDTKARSLSVKEVSEWISDGAWRPMKSALFDPKLYEGDVDEIDGELYATDREAFDALQKAEAAAIMRQARADAKAGEIEFVESGETFQPQRYLQRKGADGKPDAAGGIFIEKLRDGEIRVWRGLFKTASAKKDDEREAARKKEAAKRRAKMAKQGGSTPAKPKEPEPPDPRVDTVVAYLDKDGTARKAVTLFELVAPYSESIKWLRDGFNPERLKAAIGKIVRGKAPSGGKLLAWCLKQTPATLNALLGDAQDVELDGWYRKPLSAKPTAAEQILFDHCGAKLPDELALPKGTKNAKTAGPKRTASKSKPKPKSKKGKKP